MRVLIAIVFIAAIGFGAIIYWATPLLRTALNYAGIEVVELAEVRLTERGITIHSIELGTPLPLKATTVQVDVSWGDIREQRIGRVAFDGLELEIDAASFTGSSDREGGADPAALLTRRLGSASLTDSRIGFRDESVRLQFSGNASMSSAADSLEGQIESPSELRIATETAIFDLDGFQLNVSISPSLDEFDGNIDIATLRQANHPAYFTDLAVSGEIRGNPQKMTFEGEATPHAAPATITFDGEFLPARGSGLVRFETADLRFSPDSLELADLTGMAPSRLGALEGDIQIIGKIHWGAAPYQLLRVALEDVGFNWPPIGLRGINGVLDFDRLAPPRTLSRQDLAIGLLDIGLPLEQGRVTAALNDDGVLAVDRLQFDWAGGRLWAEPFDFPLDQPSTDLALRARGLELAAVLERFPIAGLEARGTMDGTVPLRLRSDQVIEIDQGKLATRGPGVVRYRPETPPAALQAQGQSVGILLQALENLQYTDLSITLDGPTDGEMSVALSIAGANPDLYGGYPIEFNLNLEGELANIVTRNIEAHRLPADIAERLRRFKEQGRAP